MKRMISLPKEGNLKLTFFVRPGTDSFITPQIDALSPYYLTRKVVVTDFNVLEQEMEQSDICFFEWCDELAVAGSRQPIANKRIMICRLHNEELFTGNLKLMNWRVIDYALFDNTEIRDFVRTQVPALQAARTAIIPVGIDLGNYSYTERQPGFHIAYLDHINIRTGPELMLHAFKTIHDQDSRYKLFIAGAHQEARYHLYLEQMINQLNLTDSVQFDGPQADLDAYLEDKHYVLVTSPVESQHVAVMEAMAKGIKPLIHHFWGAAALYDQEYLWASMDQLTQRVFKGDYASSRYRAFIEEQYALTVQTDRLKALLQQTRDEVSRSRFSDPDAPKITVGIINYNYELYLEECLLSVINQTYSNVEILLTDDGSTDSSPEIIRRYVEEYDFIRFVGDGVHRGSPDYATRKLFEEASGEFFMLLGPDDFLPHDRVLERYLQEFTAPGGEQVDYVYGNYTLVGANSAPFDHWKYNALTDREVVWRIFHRYGSGVIPMSGLFRTSYHLQQGSWYIDSQNIVAGDTLNGLANIRRGWVRRYVDEPMLCHRRHAKNMTFQSIDNRIQSLIQLLEYIVTYFDETWYLPNIKWNQLEGNEKQALKMFSIGQHYAGMALHYQTSSFTAGFDPECKKDCVQPVLERMNDYFRRSLEAGDDYKEAINQTLSTVSFLLPVLPGAKE